MAAIYTGVSYIMFDCNLYSSINPSGEYLYSCRLVGRHRSRSQRGQTGLAPSGLGPSDLRNSSYVFIVRTTVSMNMFVDVENYYFKFRSFCSIVVFNLFGLINYPQIAVCQTYYYYVHCVCMTMDFDERNPRSLVAPLAFFRNPKSSTPNINFNLEQLFAYKFM